MIRVTKIDSPDKLYHEESRISSLPYGKTAGVRSVWYRFWKRFFDIILSVIALVVLSPVFVITAAAIVIEDGFPVIFSQDRTGLNGSTFRMYKFRSMCKNAAEKHQDMLKQNEMKGPVFKIKNDPRITKVGRFIRRTSIDELPQLINIIRGDMSIVGPRPLAVYETKHFTKYQNQRHLVKPGLICYWQYSGRNDAGFDDWIEMDLQYIHDAGLWTDMKLILKTIPAVVHRMGGILIHSVLRGRIYQILKSFSDFVLSVCVSILLLIPMAGIALVIVIMDFGNPFYLHKRIGKDGSEIGILKFRSMRMGADCLEKYLTAEQIAEYKKEFKLPDDPRLIGYKHPGDGRRCFGAFLRRSNLDELPQIVWNICINRNMSVVGPRPVLSEELEKYYTPEEQKIFLSVKPGLTGYWQAYARNDATYNSGKRQNMELWYIKNRSLWLDLRIILKTFTRFSGRGAY